MKRYIRLSGAIAFPHAVYQSEEIIEIDDDDMANHILDSGGGTEDVKPEETGRARIFDQWGEGAGPTRTPEEREADEWLSRWNDRVAASLREAGITSADKAREYGGAKLIELPAIGTATASAILES